MAVIGHLVARLSADSAAFKRDMGKATGTLRSSSAKMNRLLGGLDRKFKGLQRGAAGLVKSMFSLRGAVGALVGVGAAGGIVLLIKRSIEAADSIAKTADVIGITTDALQEYRFAAALSGVASDQMDKAFKKFAGSIGDAKSETGTLITFLKNFDPAFLKAIKGTQNVTQALDMFFDRLAKTTDQTERLALASAAFGARGGRDMILMVKDGTEGLKAMREEAQRLGIVLGESMLRQAEAANDALERMGRIVSVNMTRAMLGLAPTVVAVGAAFAEGAPAFAKWVNTLLPDSIANVEELERRLLKLRQSLSFRDTELFRSQTGGSTGAFINQLLGLNPEADLKAEIAKIEALLAKANLRQKLIEAAGAGADGKPGAAEQKISKVIEALRFQGDQLDRTAQQQAFFNALKQAGITLDHRQASLIQDLVTVIRKKTAAEKESKKHASDLVKEQEKMKGILEAMKTPAEKYADEVNRINKFWNEGLISAEQYAAALEKIKKQHEDTKEKSDKTGEAARELGMTFKSAFEDAIVEGRNFQELLLSLEKDIIRIVTRKFVTEPFADAISGGLQGQTNQTGGFSSFGNMLGTFMSGGGGGDAAAGMFAGGSDIASLPAMADGGHVTPDKFFKVGERGTEIFKPGRSGTIIPNNRIGDFMEGAGGGPAITNNFSIAVHTPDGETFNRTKGQMIREIAQGIQLEQIRSGA